MGDITHEQAFGFQQRRYPKQVLATHKGKVQFVFTSTREPVFSLGSTPLSTGELQYREEVRAAILRALASGCSSAEDVVIFLGSPDPKLVQDIYNEIVVNFPANHSPGNLAHKRTEARRRSASLPLELPASDPMKFQWWFTLDSVVALADRVWEYAGAAPVAFLGAPTVGHHYSAWLGSPTTILDADMHVVQSLKLPTNATAIAYDVADEIPNELRKAHSAVVIDPPWYPATIEQFISRARDLCTDNGHIFCILPSRLTRPYLIEERTRLLGDLIRGNFEVVTLDCEFVAYRVPEFERRAYGTVDAFSGRQWRKGDLLILRSSPNAFIPPNDGFERTEPLTFARNPKLARFFLMEKRVSPLLDNWLVPIPEFADNVSLRGIRVQTISVWGSNRKAACLRDAVTAHQVLELWAGGNTREAVTEALARKLGADAGRYVRDMDAALDLWTEPSVPEWRRTPAQLLQIRNQGLSDLGSQPGTRKHPYENDGFRLEFQRDRDRVLWSNALKRLSNKTQLFSLQDYDHFRGRLTHSIEVMQLASTIAVSFGLDRDLTEAGALVHDVGHTPFGHAGEHALGCVLDEVDPRLGGFNHYEHGVDVVCWIEDVYRSPGIGEFHGLNLTPETIECILKHAFHRDDQPLGQTALIKRSKHKEITDSSCHLEGQAVRIADKVSYLISDLEEGIRIGAFTYEDLMSCRLFERAPIDMAPAKDEPLYERFVSQRRSILKVLMEDILRASDERLAALMSLKSVRATRNYTIDFSDPIKEDVAEIWNSLQKGKLHKHAAVLHENMRAARVVRDLFLVYSVAPNLVAPGFRQSHRKLADSAYFQWFRDQLRSESVGVPKQLLVKYAYEHTISSSLRTEDDKWVVPLQDVLLAKDYVASLTDTVALAEHRKYCSELR